MRIEVERNIAGIAREVSAEIVPAFNYCLSALPRGGDAVQNRLEISIGQPWAIAAPIEARRIINEGRAKRASQSQTNWVG